MVILGITLKLWISIRKNDEGITLSLPITWIVATTAIIAIGRATFLLYFKNQELNSESQKTEFLTLICELANTEFQYARACKMKSLLIHSA